MMIHNQYITDNSGAETMSCIKALLLRSAFFVGIFALLSLLPLFFSHALEPEELTSQLIIEMDGEVRFYVTEPNTNRSGSWRMDYSLDSPNLIDYSLQNRYEAMVIGNPEPGTYQIETDYRFDGRASSDLMITYINPDTEAYASYKGTLINNHDEHLLFTFTIEPPNSEQAISFDKTFNVPRELQVFPTENNETRIIWKPAESIDESFSSYRIYKKKFNADFDYELVTETTEHEFITDIPWGAETLAPGVISLYTEFVVTQVFTDDTESFFSNIAYNNDSDQDGFSDEREDEMGTDPLNIDTDGDTLSDFEEVNLHYTNPLNIDTDGDGFNDNVELAEGTSPLDPNFYPSDGCQNPSGDWYISADCNLYQNTTSAGDIVIGNQSTLGLKERVTLFFNFIQNKILIMVGSGIQLEEGASIQQTPSN